MKTLLLIDDHRLFRSGIAMVLDAGLDAVSIHEADSLEQALRLNDIAPHLVLLDMQLQGLSGLEGISLLAGKWPGTRIVMVSAFDVPDRVSQAVQRGAVGFISKTEHPERLVQEVAALLACASCAPIKAPVPPGLERGKLTPRQTEVLDLLCQGLSNKMIGRRLGLSEHTVRGHVQATLAALGASSRAEAAFTARRLGLIL
ncbi:response regulator [Xanthomonas theicola]|uniref:DNA-binding response regulator n=2 Tax=Xanthomonas theicola TaxID=56464 RepID=A0A2S6ZCV0_9XANT|nr:response regulator transcription factor [Xanthomonas theicola]PPT88453.1 DNA-binding response regulator [Xanthomonas theicola]QNH26907.1 response regulator transcription factor [Xanthomonas theicola]